MSIKLLLRVCLLVIILGLLYFTSRAYCAVSYIRSNDLAREHVATEAICKAIGQNIETFMNDALKDRVGKPLGGTFGDTFGKHLLVSGNVMVRNYECISITRMVFDITFSMRMQEQSTDEVKCVTSTERTTVERVNARIYKIIAVEQISPAEFIPCPEEQ